MKARSKRIFEPPTPTFHAEENTHFKTIVTLYIQSRQQTEKRVFAFSRAQAYRIIVMTGRFFRLSENKGCDEQNFLCLTTSAGKSMPPLSFIWRVFATDQDTVIKPGIFFVVLYFASDPKYQVTLFRSPADLEQAIKKVWPRDIRFSHQVCNARLFEKTPATFCFKLPRESIREFGISIKIKSFQPIRISTFNTCDRDNVFRLLWADTYNNSWKWKVTYKFHSVKSPAKNIYSKKLLQIVEKRKLNLNQTRSYLKYFTL